MITSIDFSDLFDVLGWGLMVFIVAISAIIIVILILKSSGKVNIGFGKWKFQTKNQSEFIEMTIQKFKLLMEIQSEKTLLKDSRRLFDKQISYTKTKCRLITELLLEKYKEFLENKTLEESEKECISRADDYKNYFTLLMWIWYEMVDKMAEFFEENGITEKDKMEFLEYKQDKIKIIIQNKETMLDNQYTGKTITRKELHDMNIDKCFKEISEILNDAFDHARNLAILNKKRLIELEFSEAEIMKGENKK